MTADSPADEQAPLFHELVEVLDPKPHDGAFNMAIDEVLLRTAHVPLLRVYHWVRPTVSFGYFGSYDAVARVWPDRELVRRWTGGGIVPHGSDITYTLVVPADCAFFKANARESYRLIHERLAGAMPPSCRGIQVAPSSHPKVSEACFENPAQHDLLMEGRKIAGAAQRRTREGLLHQGSIQDLPLAELLRPRLARVFAAQVEARALGDKELEAAVELSRTKYATDTWLRRH